MRHPIRNIICTAMIAASLTLTVGAAEAEQITTTGEETTITTTATAATEEQTAEASADAATPEETLENIGAEVEDAKQTDANGEKDTTETITGADLTEEEMRDMILRVAEAVGAYEDDIPAAGKAKQWIIDNLSSLVGFLMALAMLILTPVGRKIFKTFITVCKNTLSTVGEWKNELMDVIAKNGEKNAELRASVHELMSMLTRENARAEEAEKRAAEAQDELARVTKQAEQTYEKCVRVNEAVCRAALVMAKPLEMTVQRSKALDEMQKHEIFTEYREEVDNINALLRESEEVEEVAD